MGLYSAINCTDEGIEIVYVKGSTEADELYEELHEEPDTEDLLGTVLSNYSLLDEVYEFPEDYKKYTVVFGESVHTTDDLEDAVSFIKECGTTFNEPDMLEEMYNNKGEFTEDYIKRLAYDYDFDFVISNEIIDTDAGIEIIKERLNNIF